MISDNDCAELSAAIYADPKSWDHYDNGDPDGICWGVKTIGTVDVVIFRGSKTIDDWLRDLMAAPNPFAHPDLGPVHSGFLVGISQVVSEYTAASNRLKPFIVTGHSLGAARAAIFSGLAIVAGWQPAGRVVFGEPKPGFAKLATLLAPIKAQRSYRNGDTSDHDLVTDVAFSIPPLLAYVHPVALTEVCAAPQLNDPRYDVFAWHAIPLYCQATPATPIL